MKGWVRGTAKGTSIIIILVMTRFCMLEVPIEEEDVSDCLGDERESAAVVSITLSAEGGDKDDYQG